MSTKKYKITFKLIKIYYYKLNENNLLKITSEMIIEYYKNDISKLLSEEEIVLYN